MMLGVGMEKAKRIWREERMMNDENEWGMIEGCLRDDWMREWEGLIYRWGEGDSLLKIVDVNLFKSIQIVAGHA